MADVITRFKLETTQYDSKLRDSVKSLKEVVNMAELAGKDFKGFSQKTLEAARSLGTIETGAINSKDKVKELVSAFNDMAKTYNTMSKDLRESDVGKALAESMTTLKGRISEAKAEMNSTGGIMDQLAQKFTINIDAVKLFNVGLQAAEGALKVAKDAFFASEASVDEWGRTMQSAQGLYEGFLNAINNGDISGYLSRMDDIVKAAREAYNAMDTLQTMKTIQGPQFAKQEAENNRIRMMIQTGRWISASDGRKSPLGLKDGDLLSPAQIRILERQLQGGMQTIVSLTKNELKQTGVAIDDYYNSLAKQNGMSLSEFRQGTSNWGAFSEKMAGYEAYKKWDAQARAEFARQGGQGYVNFDKNNPYAEFRKWGTFRVDKMGENSYNELVGLIKQQQQQQSQMYSTMGQAYRTINRAEGITVKGLLGGGGSGGGSGSGVNFEGGFEKFLGKSWFGVDKLKPEDVIEMPSVWEQFGKNIAEDMSGSISIFTENMVNMNDSLNNLSIDGFIESYEQVQKNIDNLNKKLMQQKMAYGLAGQAAQSFGAALQGIDNPATKAAGTVTQAVASIALGFAMASSNANTAGTGWGWLAWLAAGMAAMATTIATVHSLTGYAGGGMIKGNSYSGDKIGGLVDGNQLVGLNAGEIVLNQAQQSNVASALKGGAMGNMSLKTKVRGTELLVWLDNSLAESGRGELVTWGT